MSSISTKNSEATWPLADGFDLVREARGGAALAGCPGGGLTDQQFLDRKAKHLGQETQLRGSDTDVARLEWHDLDGGSLLLEDGLYEPELSGCWDDVIELGRGIIGRQWGRVKRGVWPRFRCERHSSLLTIALMRISRTSREQAG